MKFTGFIVDSYHLKKFLDNNTKDLFKDFSKHLNKATDAIVGIVEKHIPRHSREWPAKAGRSLFAWEGRGYAQIKRIFHSFVQILHQARTPR